MKIFAAALIIFSVLVGCASADLNEDFDQFFSTYVTPGTIEGVSLNVVDYRGIKKSPKLYNKIIAQLKIFNLNSLDSEAKKMAFWVNVYNIGAIKMILDHYPVKSITDIGWLLKSVWNIDIIDVAGKKYTLGHIEHKILRKMGDPGIHLAISCASISCPNVRTEAYRAKDLKQQFAEQTRSFLANPKKGAYVDQKNKILYLSSIFDWFKGDFKDYAGVVIYLGPNLPEDIKDFFVNNKYRIKYMPYNWNLNGE